MRWIEVFWGLGLELGCWGYEFEVWSTKQLSSHLVVRGTPFPEHGLPAGIQWSLLCNLYGASVLLLYIACACVRVL